MVAVALVLYGLAVICFVLHAGRAYVFGLNALGLGAACIALLWWLQVLVPAVNQ